MKSLLFLLLLAGSVSLAQDKPKSFVGEIVDSSCAYNVHSSTRSHKEMLKTGKFGKDAIECTRLCVQKFGSSYVLVHNNDVYRLAQQKLAEPFAGVAVKVEGTLSPDGKTIHIDTIEAAK